MGRTQIGARIDTGRKEGGGGAVQSITDRLETGLTHLS